ncbi:MAG TPA: glycosyltransferase, partial [Blastocatellia bacterium]|nr:glycosyltransferase [Blastocatellia bacterium]
MNPLVSVLIPCYNAERWVGEAIESALDQTWPAKEVIVVDDGSTDNSLQVIKSFGDRIQWETGPNGGGNVARNRLLNLARGEWLQFLDADDYLLPRKIGRQLAFLSAHPEAKVICGPVIWEYSLEGGRQEWRPVEDFSDVWVLLARWFLPGTGGSLWNKQAILDVGSWKEDQPCCQENDLYLRLLMAGKPFVY